MEQVGVFKSSKSQAVCLTVSRNTAWKSWFDAKGVSEDFMQQRNQPTAQIREITRANLREYPVYK